MTMLVRTHPLVETVSKACGGDEGTARVLVELALYEALCDEVDRVRPHLEADVSKAIGRAAARGLQALAKREATPAAERIAEQLYGLVQVGKRSGDDPNTPYWDAREGGRFVAGTGRGRLADGLKMLTQGRGENSLETKAKGPLDQIVNGSRYDRANMLGNALTSVGTPETRALGTMARVVGELGPEAQAALEPGIRRTAYRYRGTERRPAAELQRDAVIISRFAEFGAESLTEPQQARLVTLQRELNAGQEQEGKTIAGIRGAGRREVLSPAAAALAEVQAGTGLSADQKRMRGVGAFGVLKLKDQLADPELVELSLAANKMPPSLGLLMDKDGRVVSEAMGFNGDHYLPFDLKNLKQLKGGQYVRTRASGGPTDEDIYTGLMTGTRQIQVVSNSGVFRVEFDPDLRGGRRYSDKARQMVDRYSKLVAVIQSGDQEKKGLSREVVNGLRTKALDDARQNVALATTFFDQYKKDAIAAAKFTPIDEDALREEARDIAGQEWKRQSQAARPNQVRPNTRGQMQAEKEIFESLKTEAYEGRYQTYKADGEGYHAALKALKQEFPYFVRNVDFQPLDDYLIDRRQVKPGEKPAGNRGPDKGYTERGGLGPKDTNAWSGGRSEARPARASVAAPATAAAAPAAALAAGAATPAAQATAAAAAGAAAPAALANGREAGAPPLAAALAKSPFVKRAVHTAVQDTLMIRREIGAPLKEFGPTPENWQAEAHELDGEQWSDLVTRELNSPTEIMNWLMAEDTDSRNLIKAVSASKRLASFVRQNQGKGHAEIDAADPDAMDAGAKMLERFQQSRKPFADMAPDPSFGEPDEGPQPFQEILAEGASVKNLQAYAAEHVQDGVAAQAARFQGMDDGAVKEDLRESIEQVGLLIARDPSLDPAKVQRFHLAGALAPELKDLEAKQKGWALKRAAEMAAFAAGLPEPPPFGQPVQAAKRWERRPLRVLSPGSPVAKAYAAKQQRRRAL